MGTRVYMYVKLDRQDRPDSVVTWSDVDSIGDEVITWRSSVYFPSSQFRQDTARSTTQKKKG